MATPVAASASEHSSSDTLPSERRAAADHGPSRLASRLSVAAVVVALLPVAVATTRALERGWLPVSDDAFFAIRARDVLTEHHPLLGTWSSASLTADTELNHPGPLLFDVLALPVRLLGGGAGLALGVALVNGLAVVGIAIVAYRRGGPLLGTVAAAVAAALGWAMGSEALFEPWQPHSVLLPFLCFLMLVWSVACGDLAALPWTVGVGSLVLQTHLSYGFLVPALGVWAVAALVLDLRWQRHRDPGSWPRLRGRALRAGTLAGLVLAACWAQPVVEQLTGDGQGNLSRLVASANDPAETIGYDRGARLVVSVVSLPPWWLRPSFREAWLGPAGRFEPEAVDLPSPGLTAVSLAGLAAVLAWCARDARRRRDRDALRVVATAAVAVVAGLATAGRTPLGVFGLAPHQFRWLWPLAAFVSFAVAATLARRLRREAAPLVGAFALVAVVPAVLSLPTSSQAVSPNSLQWSIPTVRDLGHQMAALEGEGPLLVDDLFYGRFTDPYGTAVLAELQRRGIPFVVDDAAPARQLGPARRFTGDNARATLFLRVGDAAGAAPPRARRVAFHAGLTDEEQRELAGLEHRIGEYLRPRGRLRLNDRGRAVLHDGELPVLRGQLPGQVDPEALFASRELVAMVRRDLLVLDEKWARRLDRYADRQLRWDDETAALFVRPLGVS